MSGTDWNYWFESLALWGLIFMLFNIGMLVFALLVMAMQHLTGVHDGFAILIGLSAVGIVMMTVGVVGSFFTR